MSGVILHSTPEEFFLEVYKILEGKPFIREASNAYSKR